MTVATKALDCGQSFMQSSIPDSHAYGSLESIVWLNTILEAPESLVDSVATWRGGTKWMLLTRISFRRGHRFRHRHRHRPVHRHSVLGRFKPSEPSGLEHI